MHNQAQIITHLLKYMNLVAEVIYSVEGDGQADQDFFIFFFYFLTGVEF